MLSLPRFITRSRPLYVSSQDPFPLDPFMSLVTRFIPPDPLIYEPHYKFILSLITGSIPQDPFMGFIKIHSPRPLCAFSLALPKINLDSSPTLMFILLSSLYHQCFSILYPSIRNYHEGNSKKNFYYIYFFNYR